MTEARYLVGDVYERMAELETGSVDLIMCSPPFLALRSYLPADHPDKAKEIGSEATPAAFIDTLLALSTEWRRILAPHGSICIELGDTYAGAGDSAAHGEKTNSYHKPNPYGSATITRTGSMQDKRGPGWPLPKSLALIPELYRIGLAYGTNPLTGQPSPAGRWRVRNVVRWHRPNPPVGALGDKYRPATSDMVIACMSAKRYFDLDAVRSDGEVATPRHYYGSAEKRIGNQSKSTTNGEHRMIAGNPAGAPPLDTWIIPTEPFRGSHYATFPRELCVKPILSMSPPWVCRDCGKPRERIVDNPNAGHGANMWNRHGTAAAVFHKDVDRPHYSERTTLGWSDCGHDNYRRGLILDPFAGTGTTLAVATGNARDAIGIDIDARNLELARERIGMFLVAS